MSPFTLLHNSRGVALVMALLVLMVVSLVGAILMMTLNIDTKIAGHSMRTAQALNVAEAGVGEALSRIRSGDIPCDAANPRAVSQIFLTNSGSVPVLGADSTALATAQSVGDWLNYSTASKGPEVLTVEYKTNDARTQIYRYDSSKDPPVQTTSGLPIFVISATGRKGVSSRRVVTEVIQKPVFLNVFAAVAADVDIKFTGNAVVCGYNHSVDTPTNAGDDGRSIPGGCNEDPGALHWEIGGGEDKTGIWSGQSVQLGAGAQAYGAPSQLENQPGFYLGPWESVGMAQAEFFSWMGPPRNIAPPAPNGIIYLDNNSISQDQSGSFSFSGATGSGMLYVDGDLTLNHTFIYRGLVYIEGDLKLNGNAWILGALIVRGKTELQNNGAATTLFSKDSIVQNIARHGGQFVTLSWREKN